MKALPYLRTDHLRTNHHHTAFAIMFDLLCRLDGKVRTREQLTMFAMQTYVVHSEIEEICEKGPWPLWRYQEMLLFVGIPNNDHQVFRILIEPHQQYTNHQLLSPSTAYSHTFHWKDSKIKVPSFVSVNLHCSKWKLVYSNSLLSMQNPVHYLWESCHQLHFDVRVIRLYGM